MPTQIENGGTAAWTTINQSLNTTDSPTFAKITLSTGAAGATGTATLSGGAATVSTTAVTANSKIFLTWNGTGTLTGTLHADTITPGTSFVITSSGGSDTAQVNWLILN